MVMRSFAAATSKAAMLKPLAGAASQELTWPFFKVSASSLINVWCLWMILTPTPVSAFNSTTVNKTSCFSGANNTSCRLLQVFSIVSLGLVWFLAFGLCFWRFLQFRAEQQLQKQEDEYQRRRIYKKPSMEKMTLILIACLISQCSAQPEASVKATQYKWLCVAEIECKDKELTHFQWRDDIINQSSLNLQLDRRLVNEPLICVNNYTKLSTELDLRDYIIRSEKDSSSLFIIARFPELRAPALLSCLPVTFAQNEALQPTPATNYILVYVIIFMLLKVKKPFYLCLLMVGANADVNFVRFEHENAEFSLNLTSWKQAFWSKVSHNYLFNIGILYGVVDRNKTVYYNNAALHSNLSLMIQNISMSDNGTYMLQVDSSSYYYNLRVIASPFLNISFKNNVTKYAIEGTKIELNYSISNFKEASWSNVTNIHDITKFGTIIPGKIEKEFSLKPLNFILNTNLSLIINNASSQNSGTYALTITHLNNTETKLYYLVNIYKPLKTFNINVSRVNVDKHWCQVSAACRPFDKRPYFSAFKWRDDIEINDFKTVMLNTSDSSAQILQCKLYTPVDEFVSKIDITDLCSIRNSLFLKHEDWTIVAIFAPICFLIIGIVAIYACCKFNPKYTFYALLIHKGADAAVLNSTHYDSTYQTFVTIIAVLSGISFFVGSVHVILWCLFKFYKK